MIINYFNATAMFPILRGNEKCLVSDEILLIVHNLYEYYCQKYGVIIMIINWWQAQPSMPVQSHVELASVMHEATYKQHLRLN